MKKLKTERDSFFQLLYLEHKEFKKEWDKSHSKQLTEEWDD